jgi:hypothetical protein
MMLRTETHQLRVSNASYSPSGVLLTVSRGLSTPHFRRQEVLESNSADCLAPAYEVKMEEFLQPISVYTAGDKQGPFSM